MEKEYRIVAVDFDCTLTVNDAYPFAGRPNMTAIKILKEYRRRGNKLILWTCRVGEALENALNMCKEHGDQSFCHLKRDEQKHRPDRGNDLRIHQWKVIHLFHQITDNFLRFAKSDCCNRSYYS